jgi:S-adenosylmethionine:tRNA ribosyltransferase-isomerase
MVIAAAPLQRPLDAKLLVVDAHGRLLHGSRARLAEHLRPGDLLIANDAATIPASLRGIHERTGAGIEVRLAGRRSLEPDDVRAFTAVTFGEGDHRTRTEDRPPPPPLEEGDGLQLGPLRGTVMRVHSHPRLVVLGFDGKPDAFWAGIAEHGRPIQYAHVVEPLAMWDVWTRVAAHPAAFEPPSASFALDWRTLDELGARGVDFATVTLAAGISSTGDPELDARLPLDEAYRIPDSAANAIARARARGGRVVAMGTTVTRALEHAASSGGAIRSGAECATQRIGRSTLLRVVDAIVTGVHEPGTSHHELMRAFVSDAVLHGVSSALAEHGYRSHEYGDSVLLWRSASPGLLTPREEATGRLG